MSATLIPGLGILKPGKSIVFDVSQGGGEGCAVLLADQPAIGRNGSPPGPQNQWIVELEAQGREGFGYVGRVLTLRPTDNAQPFSRIVALSNVPGARGWRVSARGNQGQKAYIQLISGQGVGAGLPGVICAQPRPRDYFFGVGRIVTAFDTIAMSFQVDNTDAVTGAWFLTFNKRTAAVLGDIPIFRRFIPALGHADIPFDASPGESGDPRYTQGLVWGVSSTPGSFTPAVQLFAVSSVLG